MRTPSRHATRFGLIVGIVLLVARTDANEPTISVDLGNSQAILFERVPAGKFKQGSPADEQGREADEAQRDVEISKDFYLGKYPVTVAQFRQFVTETNYRTEAESGTSGGFGLVAGKLEQRPEFNWKNPGYSLTDQSPVTIVTVKDALAFARWLSGKANRKIVLPSEAQWEYACRAGTTTRFYSGDDDSALDAIGWHVGTSPQGPMPVGEKQPNAFGLHDMSGNVYEWCADIFAPYPAGSVVDPQQRAAAAGETERVVLRGGSYTRFAKRCRSAARYRATPGTRNAENGFRVATMQLEATPVSSPAPAIAEVPAAPPAMPPQAEGMVEFESPPAPFMPSPSVDVAFDQPSGFSFASLLCPLSFLFAVGTFAFWVYTKMGRSRRSRTSTQSFSAIDLSRPAPIVHSDPDIRATDDGFWLETSRFELGSVIFYHYLSNGNRFESNCEVLSPDRQFIYTGVRPDDIGIDSVQDGLPDDPLENMSSPTLTPNLFGNTFGSRSIERDDDNTTHVTPGILSDDDSAADSPREDSGFARSSFPPAY